MFEKISSEKKKVILASLAGVVGSAVGLFLLLKFRSKLLLLCLLYIEKNLLDPNSLYCLIGGQLAIEALTERIIHKLSTDKDLAPIYLSANPENQVYLPELNFRESIRTCLISCQLFLEALKITRVGL